MTDNTRKALGEWAPYIAIMITVVITVAGATWTLSRTLGRLEAKVEHNAQAIERNTQAIERNARETVRALERYAQENAQAVERNAQVIERNAQANAQAIAKVQEELAKLTGQYVEHVRFHEEALASR